MPYTDGPARPPLKQVQATLTLTTGGNIYVSGDYIGTTGVPASFANAAQVSGGLGHIVGAVVTDSAAQIATGLQLWLFDSAVTTPADGAAMDVSDADILHLQGVIVFGSSTVPTSMFAGTSNKFGAIGSIKVPFKCASSTKTLYGALVLLSTCNIATTDTVTITLFIEQA